MNAQDKINRGIIRYNKNIERNKNRWKKLGKRNCPYDVEMNNIYGTCDCNGENYSNCLGDI